MKGSRDDALKRRLKEMIIAECDKDVTPDEIPDDAPLFGEDAVLELDSLDGLQISMAVQKEYGYRISDPKEMRRILASVNSLADFLQPE
ncbi:phosphopantetheine-binding protein [Alkalilimnicola sp. S0819]|uniref:phosphopantetheine-binding protein n=1 Tax=Alkalilimnicola sp. S0819 TaxID=2613922 RepID=UPI0012629D6A|nr:phosphopantetheine-binding protein [Alkalilimnicola sp. S0819]KAB7624172.1 acyl carrier protein [Alkalilimnicola sp. S0819]MPQ16425.1 acyl carrier protein [Alkalilimnicola sp. S0819]